MVLVQDENEVQEVLPTTLTLESGVEYDLEESSHQGLKSTLDWLPVETLKLLCNGEEKSIQATLEKVVGEIKRSVQYLQEGGAGENKIARHKTFPSLVRKKRKLVNYTYLNMNL
ncbi:hypothetical protein C2G38_2048140 [Gigaspora rosea]|uniref:Uncharacterized protein n=1 Tax=Gigaspora rosea TaxID=44941 RepID=A0A397U3F3_9GLOM|nr:hypothetical protein C2G38_2048140 [Gigaspora rosea]